MSIKTKLKHIKWINIVNFNTNMVIPNAEQEGCPMAPAGVSILNMGNHHEYTTHSKYSKMYNSQPSC
jgi:hypothetical protein